MSDEEKAADSSETTKTPFYESGWFKVVSGLTVILTFIGSIIVIIDWMNPDLPPQYPEPVTWESIDTKIDAILDTMILYDEVSKDSIPQERYGKLKFIRKNQSTLHKEIWQNVLEIENIEEGEESKGKWLKVVNAHDRIADRIHGPAHVKSLFEANSRKYAAYGLPTVRLPIGLMLYSSSNYMTAPSDKGDEKLIPFIIADELLYGAGQISYIDLENDPRAQKFLSDQGIDFRELAGKIAVPAFHEVGRSEYTAFQGDLKMQRKLRKRSKPSVLRAILDGFRQQSGAKARANDSAKPVIKKRRKE